MAEELSTCTASCQEQTVICGPFLRCSRNGGERANGWKKPLQHVSWFLMSFQLAYWKTEETSAMSPTVLVDWDPTLLDHLGVCC